MQGHLAKPMQLMRLGEVIDQITGTAPHAKPDRRRAAHR
jgi:hypothetical protein